MNTRVLPRELAVDLLTRSTCQVQVAAVLSDGHGIFAWGWNSMGAGFGEHAEIAALRRANPRRVRGCLVTIASVRRKNGRQVFSMPCVDCAAVLKRRQVGTVEYTDGFKSWRVWRV